MGCDRRGTEEVPCWIEVGAVFLQPGCDEGVHGGGGEKMGKIEGSHRIKARGQNRG